MYIYIFIVMYMYVYIYIYMTADYCSSVCGGLQSELVIIQFVHPSRESSHGWQYWWVLSEPVLHLTIFQRPRPKKNMPWNLNLLRIQKQRTHKLNIYPIGTMWIWMECRPYEDHPESEQADFPLPGNFVDERTPPQTIRNYLTISYLQICGHLITYVYIYICIYIYR